MANKAQPRKFESPTESCQPAETHLEKTEPDIDIMGRSIFDMAGFLDCRESYSHKGWVFPKVFVHSMPCSWGNEGMTEGPKLEAGSAAALHLHAQTQPLSRLQDEFQDHSLGGDFCIGFPLPLRNVEALLRAGLA